MKNLELLSTQESEQTVSDTLENHDINLLNRVWTSAEIYQYANENLLAECQYYFPFPSYRRFNRWFE
jgi:hypothetical protein